MATTAVPAHGCPTSATAYGEQSGIWSWLTTVDHKRIGVLYLYTALAFFLIGGLEALIIRIQLRVRTAHVVSAEMYNQLFTMHGTTMIFLAVMPLSAAFFNFLIPLQIGARDVAFPRLNAFSYWVYLFGGIFITLPILFQRRAERRLVRLRAAHDEAVLAGNQHRLLGDRPPDPRHHRRSRRRSTSSRRSSISARPA